MDRFKHPLVSVIILNYNGREFLNDCLESVLTSDYENLEVLLADNASSDDSLNKAKERFGNNPRLRIIYNSENLLYTGGNNAGIKAAKGDYLVILNNDTLVDRRWLKESIPLMQADEHIGAAQPKVLVYGSNPPRIDYIGGSIDRFGFTRGIEAGNIDDGHLEQARNIFYAAGTVMIIKKNALDLVGLFDESFGMHWEDTDLSWRIRLAGYNIISIPKSIVYHKGSRTMSANVKKPVISWYIRKNRIAGLIKNYNAINTIIYVAGILFIYLILFLKELVFERRPLLAMSSVSAILWNVKQLPYLLRERKKIQGSIRKISDNNIIALMEPRPLFLNL